MDPDEELVIQYLRMHAGTYLPYCQVVNRVTDNATHHNWKKVDRDTWRRAWLRIRKVLDSLIRRDTVIRRQRRCGRGRRQYVRLHEAFVRNPFYRKHD